MSDNRRFKTAWDVAKWIDEHVDWRKQGHRDPIDAALWWFAAQQVESMRDFSGREMIHAMRDGFTPTHPDDINNDISARYEDLEHDQTVAEKDTEVDAQIESSLQDFWINLRGES